MQQEACYYRAQAQICIALAQHTTDRWVAVALHEMAAKYISHAAKLEAVDNTEIAKPNGRLVSEPS
jgi:hypothetical protein